MGVAGVWGFEVGMIVSQYSGIQLKTGIICPLVFFKGKW
jgi:hypothetical protein